MITGEQLSLLPNQPGVYLMKNAQGEVVYIGKAIDIQKRLRSHCQRRDGSYASPFVEFVDKVDVIITDNDVEALLLEYNLIKKHNPAYNVKLKDDKRYPYIKITIQEDYPRAYLTRTAEADGANYFGPFPHVTQARRTLSALHEIFPLRACKYESNKLLGVRPCLDYEMGRCCAPCGAVVGKNEYRQLCQGMIAFLRGNHETVIRTLRERMESCSTELVFEKAAFYRDILQAANQFVERQKMMRQSVENQDFVGYGRVHDVACIAVIRRRGGRVVGASKHFLDDITHADTREILYAFLLHFYANNTDIPKEIYLSSAVGSERAVMLEKALTGMIGQPASLKIPQRGGKHAMLQLAEKNALHHAEQQYRNLRGVRRGVAGNVIALQESLRLEVLPLRIEGYDISNTQGNEAVGSMVVFVDGKPYKSGYRRFKIKSVEGPNDFAMMQEMLRRRFLHGQNENSSESGSECGDEERKRFADPPDLILIDGGKGHLHAAMEILDELDIQQFPICSLAKREEEIFLPGFPLPVRLDRRNEGLKLLQQVRDEAHRFGITYHRNLRGKRMKKSVLRDIPGIGPAKERVLLQKFGSLEKLREASVEDLQSVFGVTASLAEVILINLKGL
jgi:excinuclease ABC subunit C